MALKLWEKVYLSLGNNNMKFDLTREQFLMLLAFNWTTLFAKKSSPEKNLQIDICQTSETEEC